MTRPDLDALSALIEATGADPKDVLAEIDTEEDDRDMIAHVLWTMGGRVNHTKCRYGPPGGNDGDYTNECRTCETYLRAVADSIALIAYARELEAEAERLHTWAGLMELLNEHWPDDIFPTLRDNADRDPGPRIVSLLRWVDRSESQVRELEERIERAKACWIGPDSLPSDYAARAMFDALAVSAGEEKP